MNDKSNMKVQVDWYTRVCLTAIAVLLTIMVVGLWADGVPSCEQAAAEEKFSGSGQQALQQGRWGTSSAAGKLAATQSETNQRLEELISLLKTGEAKVQVVGGDATSEGGSHAEVRRQ